MLRMIKRLFHEPGEGLWSPIADLGSNDLDQRGVSRLCPQRPTRLRRKLRRGKRPTRDPWTAGLSLVIERWLLVRTLGDLVLRKV